MLDPRFESMQFITTYLGHENVIVVVVYGEELLLPLLTHEAKLLMLTNLKKLKIFNFKFMLFKFCFIPHQLMETFTRIWCQENLLDSISILLMQKIASAPYLGGAKNKTIAMITQHILGILANQIKIKHFFDVFFILIAFQRCHFQIDNMDKLIFFNKIWPLNPQIGCLKSIDFAFTCEVE